MTTKLAAGGRFLLFWCPGCDQPHQVVVTGSNPWSWDGDRARPTIYPSILVSRPGGDALCHSFVREGSIQFLNDCSHPRAGQTMPLPEWPYAEGEYGGVDPD